MPLQKIKHKPTPSKRESQSQIKYPEKRRGIASMLSSWLGLNHPKHCDKGRSSNSSRDESFDKGGSSHTLSGEDEHAGPMTVTLANPNIEAAMEGKTRDQHHNPKHHHRIQSFEDDEVGVFHNYVNSNCQGVNNSIMLDASYTSNDPGVHINIEEPHDDRRTNKNESNES